MIGYSAHRYLCECTWELRPEVEGDGKPVLVCENKNCDHYNKLFLRPTAEFAEYIPSHHTS